jgi:BlaI family penicillinase repressor
MKRSAAALGDAEMEILQHVWDLRQATVAQVHERILAERKVAYTTIMTTMQNLAKKGYLIFEKEGMSYVYQASIDPAEVRQNLLTQFMDKAFRGSPMALVQTLLASEEISDQERDAIRKIIDDMR